MTTFDSSTVFVVDDDAAVRLAIQGLLHSVGLRSEAFATALQIGRGGIREGVLLEAQP